MYKALAVSLLFLSSTASAQDPFSFNLPLNYATASDNPSDLLVVDFNGDGFLDLIAAADGKTSGVAEITVSIGDGLGCFDDQKCQTIGTMEGMDVGDFNEDGLLDLACVGGAYNTNSLNLQVYFGTGGGGLSFGSIIIANGVPGDTLRDVAAGDFNEDGHLDAFVVGDYSASLYFGVGDGTFVATSFLSTVAFSRTTAACDLNHDGHLDALAGDAVFLGDGNGVLTKTQDQSARYATLGDVDLDGNLDIVGTLGTQVEVSLGLGDGSFERLSLNLVALGTDLRQPAIGDFDQDGAPDLAVVDNSTSAVFLLRGTGAGHFALPVQSLTAGLGGTSVVTGDFNLDGASDLAILVGLFGQAPTLQAYTNTTPASDWISLTGDSGLTSYGSPSLTPTGPISPGASLNLGLDNTMSSSAPWFLVVGSAPLNLPLYNGVLVPTPDLIQVQSTSASGSSSLPITWPLGLPPGSEFYFQAWVIQGLMPLSVTSSNAVLGIQP